MRCGSVRCSPWYPSKGRRTLFFRVCGTERTYPEAEARVYEKRPGVYEGSVMINVRGQRDPLYREFDIGISSTLGRAKQRADRLIRRECSGGFWEHGGRSGWRR